MEQSWSGAPANHKSTPTLTPKDIEAGIATYGGENFIAKGYDELDEGQQGLAKLFKANGIPFQIVPESEGFFGFGKSYKVIPLVDNPQASPINAPAKAPDPSEPSKAIWQNIINEKHHPLFMEYAKEFPDLYSKPWLFYKMLEEQGL